MKNKKIEKIIVVTVLSCLVLGMIGMLIYKKTEKKNDNDVVELCVWMSAEEKDLVAEQVAAFKKIHPEAKFKIRLEEENVAGSKKLLLNDMESAADIYNFANDQFLDLLDNNALCEINDSVEEIISECGGKEQQIVKEVYKDGKLYAYPYTTGNGYFLFYDKRYLKKDDVSSLEKILDIAAKNNKYFLMDWTSGWYTYSFFGAAGMSIKIDEKNNRNACDFNRTTGEITGLDVTNKMLNIAKHKGFKSVVSEEMLDTIKQGNIIAVVSGTWNTLNFEKVIGKENLGACKLPTVNIKGKDLQMRSFTGYKYLGVNPASKETKWAMELARWFTNYENQIKRFDILGECPSNKEALNSEKVQLVEPVVALSEQEKYAIVQSVYEPYWYSMSMFGTYLSSGNPDNVNLQELLDKTVKDIVAEITKGGE